MLNLMNYFIVAAASDGVVDAIADKISLVQIVGYITTILSEVVKWVETIAHVVTTTPLLLFFVLLGGIYIGLNFLRRLMHI